MYYDSKLYQHIAMGRRGTLPPRNVVAGHPLNLCPTRNSDDLRTSCEASYEDEILLVFCFCQCSWIKNKTSLRTELRIGRYRHSATRASL